MDAELREASRHAEPRARELRALTHEAVRAAYDRADVELIHFGSLQSKRR